VKAPFPYFGGKSKVASLVWDALGQPRRYIEPFFGSGAVLLARPGYDPAKHNEIVNDADGFICNVWRGIQFLPDEVARWCDWPINHADLCARKRELVKNEERLLENLIADPTWCDPVLAGYWIWAASCWIGAGLTRPNKRPQTTGWSERGVHAAGKRPKIDEGYGKGIHSAGQIPNISRLVGLLTATSDSIKAWMRELSDRLRKVIVICGDWTQVCGGNWQDYRGDVGIFFDPPYGDVGRDTDIYHKESMDVAATVNEWALARGDRPTFRIVLAGYRDEHQNLLDHGWTEQVWKTNGGYGNQGKKKNVNRERETLFFSPHCNRQGRLEI
jgi:DNA adenine methylase